ncbi:beta strand repeat-containing protein, partial [Foetidibacter luteolus]|uniref:beta strand repeat-containing protein n=1 Tax=Foetidibacter luteolus TaxID=2608880 RepID=UPI00129B759F
MKQALAGTVKKSLAHSIKNNLSINALPFFDSAGTSRLSYCGKSMPGSRLILYSHSSCHTRYIFLTVFVMLFALSGQAQQLEIFSGSGPAGNGPSANSGASTFYRNTATSATFTAHTPTLTYALSFTNQQYTTATTPGLTVGAQNTGSTLTALAADALLQLMNSNGGGVNSEYTSNPFGSPGTDFSTSSNYGFKLSTDAAYQQEAGAALNARNYYGDMTITFSRPVLNPVIHLAGIGGGGRTVNYGMGYYTEFEMSTADVNAGYTLTRLSGTTYLNVTSTGILNSSTTPASVPPSTSTYTSQAAGNNGSGGSIRVNTNGTFISSLTFRVYLRGDGSVGTGAAWNTGNRSGDGFMLSVSLGLYNVNGTVYNDANGLTDNTVNGTGSNGGGLFANLVDASGIVVSSVAVAANGTYTLSNTPAGNYTIILTTTTAAVGSSLSVATLPVGYGSTGEFVGATAGNDGTVDSKLAVTVTNGNIANANLGMQTGWYDFGDAPASFDLNSASSSVPARNGPSSTLLMGTLPDFETAPAAVANGSDNNGSNGDGVDEDGQTTPAVITIGSAYSRTITYTNTSGTSRTVYGWIDFNNNGIFEAAEVASTLGTATTGVTNGTTSLTWSATQTRDALAGNLYMRIRVSASTTMADNGATAVDERAIADGANGGTYGTAFIGEVEDYRVTVTALYDMGDVPASYERNASSVSLPARNVPSATLRIGTIDDAEFTPASVASGSNNNGSNGDGTEEDGATSPPPAITAGLAYTLPVTVTNTSGTNRVLHGWVDFNNNGIFEATEYTSVTVNTGTNGGSVNLAWTSTQTRDLTGVSLYMRLRLAAANLADNSVAGSVDERAIADGASTGIYSTTAIGEVEDYRVTVNPGYDMGDAPASYELNSSSTSLPARNIPSATLRIGTIDDVEFTP